MVASLGIVMEIQHWLTLLGIVSGLVVQAILGAVFLTQKLAGMKEALTGEIIEYRDEVKAEIAGERRITGESMAALRQKINDVELEAAKVYVRRDSWHQAMNQLQIQLAAGDKAAEERTLRIEAKVDSLLKHILERGSLARPA